MKLGVNLGYWGAGNDADNLALAKAADHALALAVGVDVCGVDERAACLAEGEQLRGGVVLVGVAAPRHRAEGEPGDDQTAAAEMTLLHAP